MQKILFTVFAVVISFPIQANTIGFDEALKEGEKNSVFSSTIKSQRLNKYGTEIDETNLENPEIEYEFNTKYSTSGATFFQPLRGSDISFKRSAYKSLLEKINYNEEKLDKLRINHAISDAYYNLYTYQEEAKFAKERLTFLDKAQGIIKNSVNQNNMLSSEVLAFDADILATKTVSDSLNTKLNAARLKFLEVMNMEKDKMVELQMPPDITCPHNLERILATLNDNPSYKKMLELAYKKADDKLGILAQDRALPMIAPKVFYAQNPDNRQSEFGVGLAFKIPLWNVKSGEYEALKAVKSNLQTQISSLDQVDFDEVINASYNRLHTQTASLNLYISEILPKYKKSVEQIEESFLNGQSSILDVWQIREKYFAAQSGYLDVLKSALDAKIELETLIGEKLENIK